MQIHSTYAAAGGSLASIVTQFVSQLETSIADQPLEGCRSLMLVIP